MLTIEDKIEKPFETSAKQYKISDQNLQRLEDHGITHTKVIQKY